MRGKGLEADVASCCQPGCRALGVGGGGGGVTACTATATSLVRKVEHQEEPMGHRPLGKTAGCIQAFLKPDLKNPFAVKCIYNCYHHIWIVSVKFANQGKFEYSWLQSKKSLCNWCL